MNGIANYDSLLGPKKILGRVSLSRLVNTRGVSAKKNNKTTTNQHKNLEYLTFTQVFGILTGHLEAPPPFPAARLPRSSRLDLIFLLETRNDFTFRKG